ncbi:unnamed protein product [Cylindrotheca closterium]|uniref:Uncharacterized protein n=1 Tax=Cylindrotheca closterium TaxID=2856 RepID=A0AAD2PY67_9STRA|nr:unnamed protein product [Cylindrotheca closterium]
MAISRSRLILQRQTSGQSHLGRKVSGLLKRTLSSAPAITETTETASVVVDLPTRHSWKQPPRICGDVQELTESTASILEQPLGSLYVSNAAHSFKDPTSSIEHQRNEVYETADATIQQVEYLMRGHASFVEGSIYDRAGSTGSSLSGPEHLEQMQQLLQKMQQEGNLYMRLREEHLKLAEDETGEEDGETVAQSEESPDMDFAPPGATIAMYDVVLDSMAVQSERREDPLLFFQTSLQALQAFELDAEFLMTQEDKRKKEYFQQRDTYTLATPVTYNAALRGIAVHTSFANPQHRDNALNASFHLYNHMTHSEHLLRNSASIGYMLQIVNQALPDSRVKGNISVTFWKQACQMGLVTPQVVESMQSIHKDLKCGPEFEPVVKQLETPLSDFPQRYRRAVKQTRHSANY